MARGNSGRIVIEVDPEAKRRLYAALAMTGSTLKTWFLTRAAEYTDEVAQPSLFSQIRPQESKKPARSKTTTFKS